MQALNKFSFFVLCLGLLHVHFANAIGNEHGNGGDVCEKRFQSVRDDLGSWLFQGGAAGLKLPSALTVDSYKQSMLKQISTAKVSCTDDKVFVGHAEKTCKNFLADDGALMIVCHANRFLNTSESDQYVLVHHEYAGLAGFEVNTDEESNYDISNQITGFLENFVIKKLVVKPPVTLNNDPFDPNGCQDRFTPASAANFLDGETEKRLGDTKEVLTRTRECSLSSGTCAPWTISKIPGSRYQNYEGKPYSKLIRYVGAAPHLILHHLESNNAILCQIETDCGALTGGPISCNPLATWLRYDGNFHNSGKAYFWCESQPLALNNEPVLLAGSVGLSCQRLIWRSSKVLGDVRTETEVALP